MIPNETRVAIVAACKRLEAGGLVAGSSGNVSVRLPEENRYAITPSGVPYRILQPEQIVEIDGEGKLIEGQGKPSSEKLAHLTAYRQRADVNAVIHSHSIYAGALALANIELPPVIDEMVVALGGAVQVADYNLPATQDLADKAIDALGLKAAVLMRNHGALGVGRDLDEALAVVEMLERSAKIYYLARLLGGEVRPLPDNVWQMEAKFFRIQHGLE
jgi:L-fuculose-phosphate aldolase